MAATVAQSQPANLPKGGTTTGPSHITTTNAALANPSPHPGHQHDQHAHSPSPSETKQPTFKPSDFKLVRTLGTGTFARVCLVRPAHDTTPLEPPQPSSPAAPDAPAQTAHAKDTPPETPPRVYALKILRKSQVIKLKQISHVRHERAILADVASHPFITTLVASFSDRDSLYMLLDYVPGGELFSYLRKLKRFDERIARFYAAEIVLVLEYLHEHQGGVAYRDLKPENLLLDGDGHIKLVDFGFAKRLGWEGEQDDCQVETYTLCGTPEYLAPEVIQNKGHTTAVDWWALGILIYEFLTGYPPFWHQNPMEIYKQIVEKPVVFPADPPISSQARSLILSLCTADRSRRLGNMSGGAADVKSHPFFAGLAWDEILAKRRQGPILPPVRYPGDAQCFDVYPEDDGPGQDEYTEEMREKHDESFADF